MSDVNQVVLIGRLVRNAELKHTPSGTAISKFSIAVNEKRRIGDQWEDSADFFEIILWGQLAESLTRYLVKGKQIAVIGKLTQERWEQNGQNRSKVTITAAAVQLLGGSSGGENGIEPRRSTPSKTVPAANDDFGDDIPF